MLNKLIYPMLLIDLEIIASAITSLVTTRFDIGISLDKNEYEAKYSKYSITLRKCLEVIARAVSDKDVSWLNSGDIEACIGAVCGIGIASSCIPCIQAKRSHTGAAGKIPY